MDQVEDGGGTGAISRRRALAVVFGMAAAAFTACREATSSRHGQVEDTTTSSSSSTSSTTTPAPTTTVTTAPPPTTVAPPPPAPTASPLPNPPEATYRAPEADGQLAGFLVIGDFGGGLDQPRVAQAMTRYAGQHRVDALVTTGDNVYDNGEPAHFAAQLDEPYRDLRAGRPMWTVLGNHDVVGGHSAEQLRWLGLPAGPYRRDVPGARLLLLDNYGAIINQARWLDEELSRPGPPAIVIFHAPIYSAGLHGPYSPLVTHWRPVIERHQVPLVLCGHDHLYQRFDPGTGTHYVVTGGGGRELYARSQHYVGPEPAVLNFTHHFVNVAVYDNRLVVTAITPDDREIDRLEIPIRVGASVTSR